MIKEEFLAALDGQFQVQIKLLETILFDLETLLLTSDEDKSKERALRCYQNIHELVNCLRNEKNFIIDDKLDNITELERLKKSLEITLEDYKKLEAIWRNELKENEEELKKLEEKEKDNAIHPEGRKKEI